MRIQNFRGFEDETITLEQHTCLVGPNGAGKSTVLAALNVFFQETSSSTEVTELVREDFHKGNVNEPIQITVTFDDLSDAAKTALEHYVRHNELVVKAIAVFDEATQRAPVEQKGERLVFKKFAPFFADERNKVLVDGLRSRFAEVTEGVPDFPKVGNKPTKAAMVTALREYEEARPEICERELSTQLFYGTTRGKGQLDPFVQWVYLPAVKDASEEAEEAGNTALGKLLQRTVRQKVQFDEAIEAIRQKARAEYDALLANEQGTLKEISASLAKRLAQFAHPDASLAIEWLQGSEKSISISDPKAAIKAQEGIFKGTLVRFGHGLQRSFLLAILQELAAVEGAQGAEEKQQKPNLILGCEEPELYQHPPQARHLSNALRALADTGDQIILTTHSPYFVTAEGFEEIRLISKDRVSGKCNVRFTNYTNFAERIGKYSGQKPDKPPVARAKLLAVLRPEPSELYFSQRLVLVEGIADRAYVLGALHLSGKWNELRRAGLHVIPADGKSRLLELLVIAQELKIPVFVIFDGDGDVEKQEHRAKHERDNKALIAALGIACDAFPAEIVLADNCAIWPHKIEAAVKASFSKEEYERIATEARQAIDPGASLAKNPALIGEILAIAWATNKEPAALVELNKRLMRFAGIGGVE